MRCLNYIATIILLQVSILIPDERFDSFNNINSNTAEASIEAYDLLLSLDQFNTAAEYITIALELTDGKNEIAILKSKEIQSIINKYKECKTTIDRAETKKTISDAIDIFSSAIKDYPNVALFYYGRGLSYNKYHISLKSSEEELDIIAYEDKTNIKKSVDDYKKSFIMNPYYVENNSIHKYDFSNEIRNITKQLVKDSKSYLKADELDLAIDNLSLAEEFDSKYGITYFYIGEYYKKVADYENAINYYEEGIVLSGNNIPIMHSIGYCNEKINDNDNAMIAYENVLRIDPTYTKSKFALANILYQTQKIENISRAETLLIDITIDDPDFENAFYVLASLYFDRQDFSNTEIICIDALNFHPRSYKLNYKLAAAYNEMGNYESAKDYAAAALTIKKKYAPASFELGIAWMNLCDQYESEKAFKASSRDRKFKSESNKYIERELNLHIKNNPNCK